MLCEAAGEEIFYGDTNGNIQAPTMLAYYAGVDFDRYEAFLKQFEDAVMRMDGGAVSDLHPPVPTKKHTMPTKSSLPTATRCAVMILQRSPCARFKRQITPIF